MMSDVVGDASNMASQFASHGIAGVSGMVAEPGSITGSRDPKRNLPYIQRVPSGVFGSMAQAFSRATTPHNVPVGRRNQCLRNDRTPSPRGRKR